MRNYMGLFVDELLRLRPTEHSSASFLLTNRVRTY